MILGTVEKRWSTVIGRRERFNVSNWIAVFIILVVLRCAVVLKNHTQEEIRANDPKEMRAYCIWFPAVVVATLWVIYTLSKAVWAWV